MRSLKCYYGVYGSRCLVTRGIKDKTNPLLSARRVYHLSPYIILYCNMIIVFFPDSIDLSLVSTNSSLVLSDASLLASLLLEPSTLQSKCTFVNQICIV